MPGEVGRWPLREIEEWRQSRKDEEQLLSSVSDSPWLEELRKYKAQQEQIKLAALRKTVVQIDRVRDVLTVWASILKRLGERIGRKYGRDAGDMVADAIEDCDRAIGDIFDTHGNGNGSIRKADDRAVASGGSPRGVAPQGTAKRKTSKTAANQRMGRKRTRPTQRSVQKRAVQAPQASGQQIVVRGFGFGVLE
jgi:hypothetical protein